MIGHAYQPGGGQSTGCRIVGRFVEHLVLLRDRQVENAHRKVVMERVRQTIRQQLAHADHGHHIAERLLLPLSNDWRHQQDPASISWLDTDQMHRLRDDQGTQLIGALQDVAAQRLREQIVAQRRAQTALGLTVQHRHVFISGGRRLQFSLFIELAHRKRAQAFLTHALLKSGAFGSTDPEGKRIGLGAQ